MKVKVVKPDPTIEVDVEKNIEVEVKPTINVEIVNSRKDTLHFSLNMRKALNGDLMIFDHKDIDIVIMPDKKKIVAFAKDLMSEVVYGAEARLMEYLRRTGIIQFDSIQGGNVYGSLEGKIHESKERDAIKATLYQVSEWMDSEAPYIEATKGHDEQMEDALLKPDSENSTELGEVPQEEEKGSIRQHNLFAPYLYGRYSY